MSEVDLDGGALPDPDAIRWVLRVRAAGSVSAAARREKVAQSTVSRAIGRLEESLGVHLFVRTGQRLRMTDAGHSLLPQFARVLGDMRRLQQNATDLDGGMQGELSISLCSTLGRHVLLPALMTWLDATPGVTLDIRFEERWLDPRAEGLDLIVRAGKPPESDLRRTAMGRYGHVAVAAPAYLQRAGAPEDPDELSGHHTLAMRLERVWGTWLFQRGSTHRRVSTRPRVTVTTADTLVDATLHGAGITILPTFLARPHLKTGDLARVLEDWSIPTIPVFGLHAPSRKAPRIVREGLAVLKDAMQDA